MQGVKYMRVIIIVFLSITLVGCGTWRREASNYAADAADQQGENTEHSYCRGNSTGWLLRQEPEARQNYIDYCVALGFGK